MAKILLVDDAAFMRMNLKNILEKENHKIIAEAENGREAIEKFRDKNPDLTILDITMPEMDGLEALKKIKNIDHDARIIMCSAMGQQNMVIEAIESGARDFVVKPFKPKRVLEAINKAVK